MGAALSIVFIASRGPRIRCLSLRKAKPYRTFSKKVFHFHSRDTGFVSLDTGGGTVVQLVEQFAKRSFGAVYEGRFVMSTCADPNNCQVQVGPNVTVKMLRKQTTNSEYTPQNPKSKREWALIETDRASYIEQLIFEGISIAEGSITDSVTGWVSELLKLAAFRHPALWTCENT